jgi:hypothetical protein
MDCGGSAALLNAFAGEAAPPGVCWRIRILAFAVNDASPAEIVGGEGNADPVARDDTDVMLSHFARKVGQYKVSILIVQFDPEHGIGKRFTDNPFYLSRFFFRHSNS